MKHLENLTKPCLLCLSFAIFTVHNEAFLFLRRATGRGRGLDPENVFQSPSNLLLTVPKWYFCCGSAVLHVMSVCIWSLAIWSAEYQLPIMLPV